MIDYAELVSTINDFIIDDSEGAVKTVTFLITQEGSSIVSNMDDKIYTMLILAVLSSVEWMPAKQADKIIEITSTLIDKFNLVELKDDEIH